MTLGNGVSIGYTFQLNEDLTALAETFVGSSLVSVISPARATDTAVRGKTSASRSNLLERSSAISNHRRYTYGSFSAEIAPAGSQLLQKGYFSDDVTIPLNQSREVHHYNGVPDLPNHPESINSL